MRTRGCGSHQRSVEFVEPDPELRRIAPRSLLVYQRGFQCSPTWRTDVGLLVILCSYPKVTSSALTPLPILQLIRFSCSNVDFSSPFAHTYFGFSLCSSFTYKDDTKPPRVYPNILGCLVRKHFHGL
jgi:hypothetical protein